MAMHNLCFRAYCQATEEEGKVLAALTFASGAEAKDVGRNRCDGYHGNPILRLDVCLISSKKIKAVFQRLGQEELRSLMGTLESRVDEDCSFYFRLDKQEACQGRLYLGERYEGDDVIAVHGKIKSYPKSREASLVNMGDFLGSLLGH